MVGGVASGKTTVAQFLADNNCEWVNADACAHSVLEREDVKQAVRDRWNIKATKYDLFDNSGRINRRILANIVFSDKMELAYLEGVMRPHVQSLIEQRIAEKDTNKHLILDIPLLYEAGWNRRCDVVWFCHADREVRFQRYMERMNAIQSDISVSIEDMDRRDNIHLTPDQKKAMAHYVIRTDQPKNEVYSFVQKLLKVVSEPTVYESWSNGLLLAEHAIHDAMDWEKTPDSSYESQWAHIDNLELHLKEEMRRRLL